MAKNKLATKAAKKPAAFTDEERAAMRERAQETKKATRPGPHGKEQDAETSVLEKIAAMAAPDRAIAERLHAIVKANAPSLSPKLWYGMPAYANENGNVVCFFQDARKFKTRYATLGFSDKARLDEGRMWPTAYALEKLAPAEEASIAELVRRAVS